MAFIFCFIQLYYKVQCIYINYLKYLSNKKKSMEAQTQIQVQVLYFASAKEFAGIDKETFHLQIANPTLFDLVQGIKSKHEGNINFISILEKSMIAVNDEYIYQLSQCNLQQNDEVAVIPPISGG